MSVDWMALVLVTTVTVLGTALTLAITASAARMLGRVHIKRCAGEQRGIHAAELAAGLLIACVVGIALFGLWLIIPYFH